VYASRALLASQYEIAGRTIINVVRHADLIALSRGVEMLRRADFEEDI
jgi:hypothetical protein